MAIIDNLANTPEEEAKKQEMEQSQLTTSESASSPADMAVGGQNPDQSKMAGTPAQQQGMAARLTQNEQAPQQAEAAGLTSREDYQESITPQQRIDAQAAEQAKQATANLQGLGSFSTRIEALVKKNLSNRMSEGLTPQTFAISDEELNNIAAEGQGEVVKQAFNNVQGLVQQGATTEQVIDSLKNVPKEAWGENGLYDAMQRIYKNDKEAMSSAVADSIAKGVIEPEELTASAVIDSGLLAKDENGTYTDLGLTEGQLVDILGENWKDLKLDQIEDKVEKYQRENLSGPEKMQEMLADPTIPASVKQQLQAELASMGASGELASVQEAQQAADVIDTADQVRMGDQLVSTDELLKDENITNDVNNLLADLTNAEAEGASTEEILEKFGSLYGEDMAEWAAGEFNTLKESGADLNAVMSEVANVQKSNQDTLGGKGLGMGDAFEASGDKIMKALGFESEGPFGQSIDPQSSRQFQWLSGLKNTDAASYDKLVDTLGALDEEALAGLGEINNEQDFNNIVQKLTTADGKEQLQKMSQMDDILAPLVNNPNANMEDIMEVFPPESMFRKLATPEGIAQQTKRLEMLAKVDPAFAETLAEFKDITKSGNPQEIAQGLMSKLGGEEGVNISNLMNSDGLWNTLNKSDQDIERQILDRKSNRQKEIDSIRGGRDAAEREYKSLAAKTPYMKDGKIDSKTAYKSHPSRGKWKKIFDAGKFGPGTAQVAGSQIFAAMTDNPKVFDSMPKLNVVEHNGRSQVANLKDVTKWWAKNVGLPNNKGNHYRQVKDMLNVLMSKGGGDFQQGLKSIFEKDVSTATSVKDKYKDALNRSKTTVPTNEWDGV